MRDAAASTRHQRTQGQLRDESELLVTGELFNTHSLIISQDGYELSAASISTPNPQKNGQGTLSSSWGDVPDGIVPELVISKQRRRAILGSPNPDASSNILAKQTMFFVIRVLRSWPRMIADDHTCQHPPMVHHVQLTNGLPVPLANCYTLVKMWLSYEEGSRELVNNTIVQEVRRLLREVCINCACISKAEISNSIILTPN
jgi:hypothetical protein